MKKPHLIFLLSDQHNAGVAGFAGDRLVRTPRLDALAASGVVLDNCYCNSPLCAPSRASMLAGLLPSETGVFNNMQGLRSDRATFVHAIGAAGYETVLAGRMHFNGPDQRHGFETRLVGDVTPSFPGRKNSIYGSLEGTTDQSRKAIDLSGPGSSAVLEFDEAVAAAASAHIRKRRDARPLFLTVGFYAPHCPYVCPPELYDYYHSHLPDPGDVTDFRRAVHPAVRKWYANRNVEDVTVAETRRVRAAYYGMVEHLDRLIGTLLDEIASTLGLENTIIVYGSDHGDNIGENGLFWKTNFYEGSARVPMVASCPGRFPGERRLSGLTSLLDVGPTFIDLCGGAPLPGARGMSLVPVLEGREEIDEDRSVISQLADLKGDSPSAMIRKRQWKLVLHHGYGDPQLFDLGADPREKLDLGRDPRHAEVARSLADELTLFWDPDSAQRRSAEFRAHLEILKAWVEATGYEGVEEWRGDPARNFLST